jgi:hypothetical protein
MKRISFGDRLSPYLLLVCVVLAGIVILERPNPAQLTLIESRLESDPADTTDVSLPRTAYITPDIKTYDEIIERPLFLEGRVPPVQPDPVQAKAKATVKKAPLRLQLEGVAITPEIRIAVVRDRGNKKLFKLEEGMEHQGWVLESINTAGATFKHGEQTEELILEIDKKRQVKRRSTNRQAQPRAVAGSRATPDSTRLKKSATTGDQPPPVPAPEGGATPDDKKGGK